MNKLKMKVTGGTCQMYVFGMSLNCPLCGVLVESGKKHECSRAKVAAIKRGPRCADCDQLLEDTFHAGVFFHVSPCTAIKKAAKQ